MTATVATSLDEVVQRLAVDPDTVLVAGGTDLMVEVNESKRCPAGVMSVARVPELRGWRREGDAVVLGAAVTYTELETGELAELLPALAQASRTVGSPQIRNAGTVGGNLATASPAGDTIPVLVALDAVVTVASLRGRRELSLPELIVGVKQTDLAPDEVIESITVPIVSGHQEFCKIGTRNAMVISVSSLALVVDLADWRVGVGLGSVAPVPRRATDAEAWIHDRIDWTNRDVATADVERFGELVAAAASPIDDHRSTADYRRHSVAVMARRALRRAFPEDGS